MHITRSGPATTEDSWDGGGDEEEQRGAKNKSLLRWVEPPTGDVDEQRGASICFGLPGERPGQSADCVYLLNL